MRIALLGGMFVLALGAGACAGPAQPAPPGQVAGAASCTPWPGGCVRVTTSLSQAPLVGEDATLVVEVHTGSSAEVTVELDLPVTFEWVAVPDGFTSSRAAGPPDAGGCVTRASGAVRPSARTSGTVRAVAPGFATVRARVVGTPGADAVFVTVGRKASAFGYHPAGRDAGAGPATSGVC